MAAVCEDSLRGEVLKPATELAMKKSAICLRASRPVGLFPFCCCSWIRLSNSSLKAWKRKREKREKESTKGNNVTLKRSDESKTRN